MLPKQNKLIDDWTKNVNYLSSGSFGDVYLRQIKYNTIMPDVKNVRNVNNKINYPFVIKTNTDDAMNIDFINEYVVGLKLNSLRCKIPNFLLTYGSFHCGTSMNNQNKICNSTNKYDKENYILLEYIKGSSLNNVLTFGILSSFEMICMLQQIMLSLAYAQDKLEFTHYDIHARNIMYTNLPSSCIYEYHINDKIFKVPAFGNCTIIDYGLSHVKGLEKYPDISEDYFQNGSWYNYR